MVTTIACLTVQPPTNRRMYDGGSISSFDSHFANISDRREIHLTRINITWWDYS